MADPADMAPPQILGAVTALAALVGGVARAFGAYREFRRAREGERLAQEAIQEAQRRAVLAAGASPFGEPSTSDRALQEARVRGIELERDLARLQAKFEEALRVRRDIEADNESLADALTRSQRELAMWKITHGHLERRVRDLEYQLGDALAVELEASDRSSPDPVAT